MQQVYLSESGVHAVPPMYTKYNSTIPVWEWSTCCPLSVCCSRVAGPDLSPFPPLSAPLSLFSAPSAAPVDALTSPCTQLWKRQFFIFILDHLLLNRQLRKNIIRPFSFKRASLTTRLIRTLPFSLYFLGQLIHVSIPQ